MLRKSLIALVLCAPVLGLGGCTTAAITMVDEAASGITGQDCSVRYLLAATTGFCKDHARVPDGPPVYCHRTLGAVECYAARDNRSPGTGIATSPPRTENADRSEFADRI